MKKIIALIVAILVIWIVLKLIGVNFSLFWSTDKKDESGKTLTGFLQKRTTYEDIIGIPLPESATDIHGLIYMHEERYTGEENSSIVAQLPKEDFYDLVEKLNLTKKPDLLKIWPEAFECRPGSTFEDEEHWFYKFWDVEKIVNEDTFYSEIPEEETYTAMKYEKGKFYFKKLTVFIKIHEKDGTVHFEKITPSHVQRKDEYGLVYYEKVK
jgi:hypothetical protein